ncbi:zf-CSL-domain-containing protein [Nemania sp. NC0429]|nr:zf-CSL-domain-containing protein [Nemania sp. NC0429]
MADEEEIAVYDEVEIEDMTFDETLQIFHYPCPCGDRFEIALVDLQDESTDIADNLPRPPEDPPSEPVEETQQVLVAA